MDKMINITLSLATSKSFSLRRFRDFVFKAFNSSFNRSRSFELSARSAAKSRKRIKRNERTRERQENSENDTMC